MTEPEDQNIFRVAVADDDRDEREGIRTSLEQLRQSKDIPEDSIIETFGDAQEIITKIEESDPKFPPWAVILADVKMPRIKDGAFLIAETIQKHYEGQEIVPLKLAAITSYSGLIAASPDLQKFDVPDTANWFWCFPKGKSIPAGSERGRDGLLSDDVWKRALRQLIGFRKSEHWGLFLLRKGLNAQQFAHNTYYSAGSMKLITKVASIGNKPDKDLVVLTGESGSGKEIVARLLHAHRMAVCNSKEGPFIPVNCASIPDKLFASQLFGHYKGAFSGAESDHMGYFEQASGGTLFLDETHRLLEPQQEALLRVIEDKRIPKLSSQQKQKEQQRKQKEEPFFKGHLIVCAASVPLASTNRNGPFIPDFYYRLSKEVEIEVPPLRERRDDIIPTAHQFLQKAGSQGKALSLEQNAEDWLKKTEWPWPGNFRTLESLLNKASDDGEIERIAVEDLEKAARKIDKADGFYELPSARPPTGVQVNMDSSTKTEKRPQYPQNKDDAIAMVNPYRVVKSWPDFAEKSGFPDRKKSGNTLWRLFNSEKAKNEEWPRPRFTRERKSQSRK